MRLSESMNERRGCVRWLARDGLADRSPEGAALGGQMRAVRDSNRSAPGSRKVLV